VSDSEGKSDDTKPLDGTTEVLVPEESDKLWPQVARGGKVLRKGIAQAARDLTGNGDEILSFWKRVMEGLEPRATMRDRMEAARMLMERAHGKAPEVTALVNLDVQASRESTQALDVETLESLAALLKE
jgi:hypothetical protein